MMTIKIRCAYAHQMMGDIFLAREKIGCKYKNMIVFHGNKCRIMHIKEEEITVCHWYAPDFLTHWT